jgi:hypothetical protein
MDAECTTFILQQVAIKVIIALTGEAKGEGDD